MEEAIETALGIRSERTAGREAVADIEARRILEARPRPRLKAQSPIPARPRFPDDVIQQRLTDTLPEVVRMRPHRLDLTMVAPEFLQGAHASEIAAHASDEETNVCRPQPRSIHGVHAARRRVRMHAGKVEPNEFDEIRIVEIGVENRHHADLQPVRC